MAENKDRRVLGENGTAYLFLAPFLLFFVGFVLYPMLLCVYMSFFDATMGRKDLFVGFGNYTALFRDPVFRKALRNTCVIVAVAVPVTWAFSLWAASVIHKMGPRAASALRIVFYLPVVTGSVAVTMVYKWIFDYYSGVLNYLGEAAGLWQEPINFLAEPKYALGCIIGVLLTTSVGQPIVLYVSALDNVDKSLAEAARVDGATETQAFWRIKWHQMKPTTLYILVVTTINAFQCFALIQLLTSGGPNGATTTIMYDIYREAFTFYRYGYGSAMGVVLAIIIAALSALLFRMGREAK